MAKVATKNAVAKVETQTALAFSDDVPEYVNQGTARGSEEVGVNDMVLPRLEIVQALSPIKEEEGMEDVRDGHLFNSVTKEIYRDLVYFIPVYYRLEYLVWKKKDEGGGFFGAFGSMGEAESRRQRAIEEEDCDPAIIEIVDTPIQYGLRVTPDGDTEQLVISMAKTKAKVSRKWNSMIQIVGGDRFSRVYKITTFTDENSKGQKFKNFVVQPAGFAPEPAYRMAESLYEVFKSDAVRVAHDSVVDNEGTDSQSAGADRGGI